MKKSGVLHDRIECDTISRSCSTNTCSWSLLIQTRMLLSCWKDRNVSITKCIILPAVVVITVVGGVVILLVVLPGLVNTPGITQSPPPPLTVVEGGILVLLVGRVGRRVVWLDGRVVLLSPIIPGMTH